MTSLVDQAREVLKRGDKILIIGVTPGNMGDWHDKDDPRLVSWQNEDAQKKQVPRNTGLILITRFTDHSVTDRMRREMPKGCLYNNKPLSTGELKALLKSAWVPLPKSPSASSTISGNGGNGDSSAGASLDPPVPVPLSAVDYVAGFIEGLPGLKTALNDLLKENQARKEEIDRLLKALAATEELSSELELHKEELAQITASRNELRSKLAQAEKEAARVPGLEADLAAVRERLAQAETELAEKAEAARRFMAAFGSNTTSTPTGT